MKLEELKAAINAIYESAGETYAEHEEANAKVRDLIQKNCHRLIGVCKVKIDEATIELDFSLDSAGACPYNRDGHCSGCENFAYYEDKSGILPLNGSKYPCYCIKEGE